MLLSYNEVGKEVYSTYYYEFLLIYQLEYIEHSTTRCMLCYIISNDKYLNIEYVQSKSYANHKSDTKLLCEFDKIEKP